MEECSGVLCDSKVPLKLKGKFCRTTIRPSMMYEIQCSAIKNHEENKLNVAKIRML